MPVKLSELHSREAEQALWVSPEGRPGGSGHDEDCVCCPSPKFPSAFIEWLTGADNVADRY